MKLSLKYHQHRIRSEIGISLETIINGFKFLTILLSNQILGFSAIFVLVSNLCEFAMLPEVCILLFPQEEEVHFSS